MKNIIMLTILMISVGCAQLPQDPYWQAEAAWQTGHVVDVLQTINGPAQDDCFVEKDPVTKRIIGKHPSTSDVIAWGVAFGAIHYGVSKTLKHYNAPKWVEMVWHSVSLADKSYTIINNHHKGIRPWGDNNGGC